MTCIAGYTIPGLQRWSNKYLIDTVGDCPLSVAVTPNGLGFIDAHIEKDTVLTTRSIPGMLMQSPAILMRSGTSPSRTIRK